MSFYERGRELGQHISKGLERAREKPHEVLVDTYLKHQLQVLKKRFDIGGFPAVAAEQLHAFNVQADYRLQDRPEFQEMRRRLNTEPGLIISNHPFAPIDGPIILNVLKRQDVQIVVKKGVQPLLARTFGEQYFLPAGKDTIKETQAHIARGGISLIFPGGQGDADRNIHFRKGFGKIVEGMAPDSMVYAFHMDMNFKQMDKRVPGAVSDIFTEGVINTNNFKDPLPVAIDERYTRAEEWQGVANRASERKWLQNDFNEYYKKIFKSD